MKSLPDPVEKHYEVKALGTFDGIERPVDSPQEVILLLHGLHERGLRIYRKLLPYLPADALILAPNGPFPLPREKEGRTEYGYAWYFYDRNSKSYHTDQKLAVSWLSELLTTKNLGSLPLTIIGFSQGGYLAPILGHAWPRTKLVIGLGCEFRDNLVSPEIKFPLIGIHGENDRIVNVDHSRKDAERLISRGLPITWETVPETAHEISPRMGERVKFHLEAHGKDRL